MYRRSSQDSDKIPSFGSQQAEPGLGPEWLAVSARRCSTLGQAFGLGHTASHIKSSRPLAAKSFEICKFDYVTSFILPRLVFTRLCPDLAERVFVLGPWPMLDLILGLGLQKTTMTSVTKDLHIRGCLPMMSPWNVRSQSIRALDITVVIHSSLAYDGCQKNMSLLIMEPIWLAITNILAKGTHCHRQISSAAISSSLMFLPLFPQRKPVAKRHGHLGTPTITTVGA